MVDTFLRGAGGGSDEEESGGQNFTQTPDNLRSTDTFEGVMGICVGPIKGPVDGLKSVRLDNTPILNASGVYNFPGFVAIVSNGDPALFPQPLTLKLGAAAAPVAVNVGLVNTNTAAGQGSPGPWVTRTLPPVNPNYIDLRFIVQQLYTQDADGIYEGIATLEIQLKPTSKTTWVNPTINNSGSAPPAGTVTLIPGFINQYMAADVVDQNPGVVRGPNFVIDGKTTTPTVFELRIWVPTEGDYAGASWDVRARLLERADYSADPVFEKRIVSWESLSAVYSTKYGITEGWRGLSWFQLYGKASDQLSGVPEVTVDIDAKIVKVPPSNVFNPTTRVYSATIWDGSWASAWTNDPAWVINDALSDSLSGLALIAPGSHLNKWDALEASKWFSQLVPNGSGGSHPRYSMNVAQTGAMKAEEFIKYLAGAVGALAWDDGNGEWRMKVDKPENPVDIFTVDNIEGEFMYSHTDVDTRFNDYAGTFLNEAMDYREDTVHVYDNIEIALLGHKPTNIALVGCTNRQEAMRRLMLRLRSSTRETKIVNFTTNRRGRNIQPLDTILVADHDLGDQAKRTTGRVLSISADRKTITLRDTVRLEVGVTYNLRFSKYNSAYNPDMTTQPTSADYRKPSLVASHAITNTSGQRGDVKVIYLSTALPTGLPDKLAVALDAVGLPSIPVAYRVLNVAYAEDNERVSISAINIDSGKWAAADNVTNAATVYVDLRGMAPKPLPPSNGAVLSLITGPGGNGTVHQLMVNWIRPYGANIKGFRVTYSVNGGAVKTLVQETLLTTVDMMSPAKGTYKFNIYTINRQGALSQPLTATIVVSAETIKASAIAYANGQTLEQLKPAYIGADPTGLNIAAGITGQGDLATQNAIDWATQVSGQIPSVGTNILLDANFYGWSYIPVGGAPNFVRATKAAGTGFPIGDGTHFLEVTPRTTAAGGAIQASSALIPVVPGRKYFMSASIQRNTSTSAATQFQVLIQFYNAAGAYLANGTFQTFTNANLAANARPVEVNWSDVAPTGAVFAAFLVYVPGQTTATGKWRVERPSIAEVAPGADITAFVTFGPDSVDVEYDSTSGAAISGQLPKEFYYKLATNTGTIASGITWQSRVVDGIVNGLNSTAAWQTLSQTGGLATFNLTSLGTVAAVIEIIGTWNGGVYRKAVSLFKKFVTVAGGGSGGTGGGGTLPYSKTTGFISLNSTAYVDITGRIDVTMPAGKTTLRNLVQIELTPNGNQAGSWVTNLKIQRDIGGVWTDQGVVQGANSSATLEDFGGDGGPSGTFTSREPASYNYTFDITGLTAGSTYGMRLVAKTTVAKLHGVGGIYSMSAP